MNRQSSSNGALAAPLRVVAGCVLAGLLLTGCGAGGEDPAAGTSSTAGFDTQALKNVGLGDPDALARSADGITVTAARRLSPRATELTVETDAVSADAPGGRNSVVVIAPENYDPSTDYPVVYMLPGSGSTDAPVMQWYESGQAEQVTRGVPAITIITSGGKEGWYTNWATQDRLKQDWETFHLHQLVPWVDSHLPTVADRGHRLVMGNSMGGYGAVRYAEGRPDLFGEAVSLSGLLDISSPAARQNFAAASSEATGETDAVFGDGGSTTEEQWSAHDPLVQSAALKDVHVQLFAGGGNGEDGDIEPALRDTTAAFARQLESRGVSHQYTEYGKVGSCDGGHRFECWGPAAVVALGRWSDRIGLELTTAQPSVAPPFKDVTAGSGS